MLARVRGWQNLIVCTIIWWFFSDTKLIVICRMSPCIGSNLSSIFSTNWSIFLNYWIIPWNIVKNWWMYILLLFSYYLQIGSKTDIKDPQNDVMKVSRSLGNVTICLKGASDIISDGNNGEDYTLFRNIECLRKKYTVADIWYRKNGTTLQCDISSHDKYNLSLVVCEVFTQYVKRNWSYELEKNDGSNGT